MALLTGAAALGPMLGIAVSGSINTVPKQPGGDMRALLDSIPQHEDPPFNLEQSASLPDHYPLVTPQGTIQVADLWLHGFYRDRRPARFGYDFGPELYEFDAPAVELLPVGDTGVAREGALSGEEKGTTADLSLDQPVAPHEAPAAAPMPGSLPGSRQVQSLQAGPKIIDVAAVLAGK